ncbi:hypothetical protein B0I27_101174 [Arcticibacter pallidicorallinus]|uniref:Uncharacterized protein n=1 Tax=Arcticibacter pallidicorallinus TaxID=1259464 RepID=A0A2T0UB89_9SPHI|nr:hypothetical protein [Arcticibacter pallidicorallinus]PRY55206.1 hypothetical protein B0I27_101174 [Arcticibacter pallidicorallinus]
MSQPTPKEQKALNLAQVETGNLQLNFAKANPKEIALYAMDTVSFQAEQKLIELELVSRNDLPNVNGFRFSKKAVTSSSPSGTLEKE